MVSWIIATLILLPFVFLFLILYRLEKLHEKEVIEQIIKDIKKNSIVIQCRDQTDSKQTSRNEVTNEGKIIMDWASLLTIVFAAASIFAGAYLLIAKKKASEFKAVLDEVLSAIEDNKIETAEWDAIMAKVKILIGKES